MLNYLVILYKMFRIINVLIWKINVEFQSINTLLSENHF